MTSVSHKIANHSKGNARQAVPETGIYKPHRHILSPEALKSLSKINPWKPICHVFWMWAGIIAAWSLVAWHPSWWTVLIAIPVIGTRYYSLFIIGHDTVGG